MLKDMATNKCLINKIKYLFFSRTLSMVNPFLRGLLKLFFFEMENRIVLYYQKLVLGFQKLYD